MMGLYIRISIRVHHLRLLSRSFNRKFLSKNRVPSFRGLIFHSVSKRKRGGEGREETDGKEPKIETFIDSSSVGESILTFERGTIILIFEFRRETFKITYT